MSLNSLLYNKPAKVNAEEISEDREEKCESMLYLNEKCTERKVACIPTRLNKKIHT